MLRTISICVDAPAASPSAFRKVCIGSSFRMTMLKMNANGASRIGLRGEKEVSFKSRRAHTTLLDRFSRRDRPGREDAPHCG